MKIFIVPGIYLCPMCGSEMARNNTLEMIEDGTAEVWCAMGPPFTSACTEFNKRYLIKLDTVEAEPK